MLIPEIAADFGISRNHLTNSFTQLVRAGVVQSTRGKGGGVRLARAPEEIRVGQIVRLSEGDAYRGMSIRRAQRLSDRADLPAQAQFLWAPSNYLYERLDEYTVADLIGNRRPAGSATQMTRWAAGTARDIGAGALCPRGYCSRLHEPFRTDKTVGSSEIARKLLRVARR